MEQGIGFLGGCETPAKQGYGSPELGMLGYWRVLRRRQRVASKTGCAVALLGLLVLLVVPWKYQSTARLEMNFATASPLDSLGLPTGAADQLGTNSDSEMGTEINAIQSEPLMIRTINELRLYLDPKFVGFFRARKNKEDSTPWYARPKEREKELTKFGKWLDVEAAPKSFNVDVSFSYPDPEISQAVVKNLVSHYIDSRYQARYETVTQTTRWLTEQLEGFRKTVASSRQRLADFMRDHDIIESGADAAAGATVGSSPSAGATSIEVQQLIDLNHQLVQGQAARVVAEAKYRLSQSQDPAVMSAVFQDDILTADTAQLASLQVDVAEARSRLGPRHPHVVELEKQIAEAEKHLNQRLDQIKTGYKNDYESALRNENLLHQQADQLTHRTAGRIDNYLQYQLLKNDLDSNVALYQSLTQKLQEAGIAASLQATHVTVINPPQVPYQMHSPLWKLVLPALAVFSIIMALIGAFVAESIDDSLSLPSDVESRVGLPVLAVVARYSLPGLPKKRSSRRVGPDPMDPSIVTAVPDSSAAEAYRGLRTSMFLPGNSEGRVLVVTSALPGDGKTVTSINIATALAQQNKRVLLIDGDFRHPGLHRLFHKPNKQGFSSLLKTGPRDLERLVVPVDGSPSLSLLPAGEIPTGSADILEAPGAKELFLTMRQQFEYVVVDSPPVIAVNDAILLGRYADAVLLVIRARKTPIEALRHAVKKLGDYQMPLKGAVLTDVDLDAPEYLYTGLSFMNGYKSMET